MLQTDTIAALRKNRRCSSEMLRRCRFTFQQQLSWDHRQEGEETFKLDFLSNPLRAFTIKEKGVNYQVVSMKPNL